MAMRIVLRSEFVIDASDFWSSSHVSYLKRVNLIAAFEVADIILVFEDVVFTLFFVLP